MSINLGDAVRDARARRQAEDVEGPRLPQARPAHQGPRVMGMGDLPPQGEQARPPLDAAEMQQLFGRLGLGAGPAFGGQDDGFDGAGGPNLPGLQPLFNRINRAQALLFSGPIMTLTSLLMRNSPFINPITLECTEGVAGKIMPRINFLEASLHNLASVVCHLCLSLLAILAVVFTLGQIAEVRKYCKLELVLTAASFCAIAPTTFGVLAPGFGTASVQGHIQLFMQEGVVNFIQ